MERLRDLPNYQRFRRPRVRAVKALNNLYVVVNVSRQAVDRERVDMLKVAPQTIPFDIPVIDGRVIPVQRRRSKINRLLKQAVDRDMISQALVSAVAVSEDYVGRMLGEIFWMYPKKLAMGVKGGQSNKKVDLARLVEADSLSDLLAELVAERISQALYASPTDYFGYLEEVLSFPLTDDTKSDFFEVKATRDLIVHADGKANATYLAKAGDLARAREGQLVPLDEAYFTEAIRALKTLVVEIYKGCLTVHGNQVDTL